MSVRVAIIGECMLELRQLGAVASKNTKPMEMGYGGDTLNTAIYLSRAGTDVSYVTALGDDPMSHWLISQWKAEGINCDNVVLMPDSVPGMYLIDVDEDGERSFFYWRKNSPASKMFDQQSQASAVFDSLTSYSHIYLSGISLAILSEPARQSLLAFLEAFHASGGSIIFDGNYRPALWQSEDAAKVAYQRMYKITSIALPTFEDESSLFGYQAATDVIDAISQLGVPEIVVKMGSEGCLASSKSGQQFVASVPTTPIDTTAAGDSFNAGYLSARLSGSSVTSACRNGHTLASKVIQHRGAIIAS